MLWHGKNFRGIINKAKEMIFDNTGTTLSSTNAEDAIKEVNSKLSDHVSVTANGTETYAQLLSRLYSLIDKSKITPKSALYITGLQTITHIYVISSYQLQYGSGSTLSSLPRTTGIVLDATSAIYDYYNNTYTDFSNNVASGRIELWY